MNRAPAGCYKSSWIHENNNNSSSKHTERFEPKLKINGLIYMQRTTRGVGNEGGEDREDRPKTRFMFTRFLNHTRREHHGVCVCVFKKTEVWPSFGLFFFCFPHLHIILLPFIYFLFFLPTKKQPTSSSKKNQNQKPFKTKCLLISSLRIQMSLWPRLSVSPHWRRTWPHRWRSTWG